MILLIEEIKLDFYINLTNLYNTKERKISFSLGEIEYDNIDGYDSIEDVDKEIEGNIIYFFNKLLHIDFPYEYDGIFDDIEVDIPDYDMFVYLSYFLIKITNNNVYNNRKYFKIYKNNRYLDIEFLNINMETLKNYFKLFKPYSDFDKMIDRELTEDINNINNGILEWLLINKSSDFIKDKWIFLIHANKFDLI